MPPLPSNDTPMKFIRYPVEKLSDRCSCGCRTDRAVLLVCLVVCLVGLVVTAYTGSQRAQYWFDKYMETQVERGHK